LDFKISCGPLPGEPADPEVGAQGHSIGVLQAGFEVLAQGAGDRVNREVIGDERGDQAVRLRGGDMRAE
jgi:hypothetical protein